MDIDFNNIWLKLHALRRQMEIDTEYCIWNPNSNAMEKINAQKITYWIACAEQRFNFYDWPDIMRVANYIWKLTRKRHI